MLAGWTFTHYPTINKNQLFQKKEVQYHNFLRLLITSWSTLSLLFTTCILTTMQTSHILTWVTSMFWNLGIGIGIGRRSLVSEFAVLADSNHHNNDIIIISVILGHCNNISINHKPQCRTIFQTLVTRLH